MATAAIERPQCRTSPSAHQALKQHFAEHPEDKLHHPHKWDVSRSDIYAENTWHPIFREMREAGPLHYIDDSPFGPYWAVVGHKAIQHIEALPDTFSSSWEHGGITILERLTDEQLAERGLEERRELPMFIAMDRPQHTGQRRTVAPKFTPSGMAEMEGEIRQRTGELLDSLPRGEVFDWVDTVSIELTTGMLAILFGFPWEDRRLLTFWSDWSGDTELRARGWRRGPGVLWGVKCSVDGRSRAHADRKGLESGRREGRVAGGAGRAAAHGPLVTPKRLLPQNHLSHGLVRLSPGPAGLPGWSESGQKHGPG